VAQVKEATLAADDSLLCILTAFKKDDGLVWRRPVFKRRYKRFNILASIR